MFRHRRSSAKPSAEFYQTFQANYPLLRQSPVSCDGNNSTTTDASNSHSDTTPSLPLHANNASNTPRPRTNPTEDDQSAQLDNNWPFGGTGLTPSLLDHSNSHLFDNITLPGYYTPTPGGLNVLFHSHQAGDLHTPGIRYGLGMGSGVGTGTPSASNAQPTTSFIRTSSLDPVDFGMSAKLTPFRNSNPFNLHDSQLFGFSDQASEAAALHAFHFPPAPFLPPGQVNPTSLNARQQPAAPAPVPLPTDNDAASSDKINLPAQDFRWHVTLNAATAMVKQANDIPITYLNKSQTYNLKVKDSTLAGTNPTGRLRYRTFVRISFEDRQQQDNPAACWQLWKEGRGTSEAHHRGGRLQAVEYVVPPSGNPENPEKPTIEVQHQSFDGFCVTWSPPPGISTECSIPVRFNFLSTDFSHSKGVKGIPVRLCAKTELIEGPSHLSPVPAEVCFCKVKLFRDHGAERKLANDVAHIKKLIEKTTHQIAQLEAGGSINGKRKRSSTGGELARPAKLVRIGLVGSAIGDKLLTAGDSPAADLEAKLADLQDMFTSARATSVLFLMGSPNDDPDAFPVQLPGAHDIVRPVSPGKPTLNRIDSIMLSASASPKSTSNPPLQPQSASGPPTASRSTSDQSVHTQSVSDLQPCNTQRVGSPSTESTDLAATVTNDSQDDVMSAWIDGVGVDCTYQTRTRPVQQPVACFYVLICMRGASREDSFHRGIYLRKRTLDGFIQAVFAKTDIEPAPVSRTFRVTPSGLKVLFDDETIAALPEAQDMIAEFCPSSDDTKAKVEGSMTYELKLMY